MRKVIPLEPGESRTFEYRLQPDRLTPGEYEVEATYYAKTKGLVPEAGEDLKTNAVKIAVEK